MKTIATPAASQASITSASRFEPPGWITAVEPAWIASSGPSAKGKKASEATAEPASRRLGVLAAGVAALLDREADRVDAAHLAGADAERGAVLGDHDRVGADAADDGPGEAACRPTAARSARSSVTTSIISRGSGSPSRSWISRPPRTRLTSRSPRVALAPLLLAEDPDRLLLLQHLERAVLVAGRDQHLDEVLVQLLGELLADRPVEGDHAAEGRHRVAGERLLVGLERVRADRHPAGVVVLDDRAGRLLEVARPGARAESRSRTLLKESARPCSFETRESTWLRDAGLGVERRPLVRVLAVGEVEHLLVGDREVFGEVLVLGREPAADRGVVAGGLGEGLVGEPVPGRGGDLAAGLLQLGAAPRRRTRA